MSDVLNQLVAQLALERIEKNLFRGQSQDLGWGVVFGGQVLGQALSAAAQTVPEDRLPHSLHGYFLRPGDVNAPVVFDVDRIRDGGSFTTRRVVAIQHGRAIFNMSCSFQKHEEGFEHQTAMPDAPDPEDLVNTQELARRDIDRVPEVLRKAVLCPRPIEIRPVYPRDAVAPEPSKPYAQSWTKTAGPLSDDPAVHAYMLAYASDFDFLTTSTRPHGVSWLTPGMQTASLDHSMWFHRPFRMDEWLLHVVESPSASGARGLVRGQFFNKEGHLVASTMQEGLIRFHKNKKKR